MVLVVEVSWAATIAARRMDTSDVAVRAGRDPVELKNEVRKDLVLFLFFPAVTAPHGRIPTFTVQEVAFHMQNKRRIISIIVFVLTACILACIVFFSGCDDDDDYVSEPAPAAQESQDSSVRDDAAAVSSADEEIPYEDLSDIERMVVDAQREYLEDEAVKEALASEITVQSEPIVTNDDSQEFEVYTLNHNGTAMKFLMETIGQPDHKGLSLIHI